MSLTLPRAIGREHLMSHASMGNEASGAFAGVCGSLARGVLGTHAPDVDAKARFPSESMQALADAGLWGLCLPTSVGGKGQGIRVFASCVEELATSCPSTAMIFVMHVTASQAIAASKTLRDRDEILRSVAEGKHLTTLALSEKGSRSHFWAPVSKLVAHGSGFKTSAFKSWVTAASHASSYVSSAQRPGAQSPLESTLYLARRGQPSLRIAGAFDGLGLRGNDSAPVSIEDHQVDAADLVTEQGQGAPCLLELVLPWFSVGTSSMANGIARAAVELTARHLQGATFAHLGSALRDLPTLRARVAEMSVRTRTGKGAPGARSCRDRNRESGRASLCAPDPNRIRPSGMRCHCVFRSSWTTVSAHRDHSHRAS